MARLRDALAKARDRFRTSRKRFRAWRKRHEEARRKRRKRRKAGKPTKAADKRVRRALRKRKHWRARTKWWVKRKTVLRRKIKRAKAKRDPEFEPWMANGYGYSGLSPALRKWIAVAVVKYDLYVTSTKRNWGTGSYHDVWRAIDVAGAWKKMIAFQRSIRCGDVSEMFGPDNDRNCKNGVRISQAEGSPNEDLHDTHVHVGI